MKTIITVLLVLNLTGCYYNMQQYSSLHNAFLQGCKYESIQSNLSTEGTVITLQATCTKAK